MHGSILILVIVAEIIGPIEIHLTNSIEISIMPLLYTMVLGLIFYLDKRITWVGKKQSKIAEGAMMLFIGILIAKLAVSSGQSIHLIFEMGPALLLQELGHLATILIALPVALLLGFKRESIGMTASISVSTLPLHPFAFAMASGVGSASMNAASLGPTLAEFPALETSIEAFAGFSNLLSFSIGIYIVIFIAVPLTEKLYAFLEPKIGRKSIIKKKEENEDA